VSDWNDYLDRLLARRDLGVEEYRLALALMRNLLGFRRREDRIGEALLREASGLHGRSFERARGSLVTKRLAVFESSGGGKGKRSLYRLVFDEETPAPEREFDDKPETPAAERGNEVDTPADTPAPRRGCSKQGKSTKAFLDGEVSPKAHQVDDARAVEAVVSFTPAEEAEIDRLWAETAPWTKKPPWA